MKDQVVSSLGEICALSIALLAGLTPALIAVGLLIMADTFTGMWASIKKKESITSRKAGRIIAKLVLYPTAIIVAQVAENYLSPDIGWTYITTSIIAIIEVKSIFENIGKILGFKLWDRFKKFVWKDREIVDEDEPEKK